MVSALTLPEEYGYVLVPVVATAFVNVFHSSLTTTHRKAAKVPYPNAYATANEAATSIEKYRFNCAQKAHANFSENLPPLLVSLMVTGLQYPRAAAAAGSAWCVGRVIYALGYARKERIENGRGRLIGAWASLFQYGLILSAGYVATKVVMA